MALIRGWRFLESARINKIVRTLVDELEAVGARNLIGLQRTAVVNADDNEIVGKFKGQFVAADIIADDQAALVYDTVGSFEFTSTNIPNIKLGSRISQHMINRLARLRRNLPGTNDVELFTDWENNIAESLITGIRQRINQLICAMWVDSGTYNRFGVNLGNANWGMPSGLKANASVGWGASPTTARPIDELLTIINETAPDTYGEVYNRLTMSTKAFRNMIKTTEFQNLAAGELRYNFGAGQYNLRDAGANRQMASNILGVQIEIYDGIYRTQENTGVYKTLRYLPEDVVLLSNTANDNDSNVMDFANGVVTESIVSEITGIGNMTETYGPIAYYAADTDLNPPDIRAWAVARGFPRKHRETATAVYNTGTLV
jgi:hypothetical protein